MALWSDYVHVYVYWTFNRTLSMLDYAKLAGHCGQGCVATSFETVDEPNHPSPLPGLSAAVRMRTSHRSPPNRRFEPERKRVGDPRFDSQRMHGALLKLLAVTSTHVTRCSNGKPNFLTNHFCAARVCLVCG